MKPQYRKVKTMIKNEKKCKVTFRQDATTNWKLIMESTPECKAAVKQITQKLGRSGTKYLSKRLVDPSGLKVLKKTEL